MFFLYSLVKRFVIIFIVIELRNLREFSCQFVVFLFVCVFLGFGGGGGGGGGGGVGRGAVT